jgi:DNA-binding transcriptional LysR family regulator
MGSLPTAPTSLLTRERLPVVKMLFVASPMHPLVSLEGPVSARILAQHRQLVLTDRSELSQGKDFGVFSTNTWRLADLGAKHAFLRAGLGWGAMPVGVIETDLADGSLVKIEIEDFPDDILLMPMSAVFRSDKPPGPAGRWLIERLKSAIAPSPKTAKARSQVAPAGVARDQAAHIAKRRASARKS